MDEQNWLLNTCPDCDHPNIKPRALLDIGKNVPAGKAYCPKCDSLWTVTRSRTPAQPAVGL
jgi:uncharacterized Zn-finger protein